MTGEIRFPHFGIALHHVIKTIYIGDFSIACYGIVLAIAMVTGLLITVKLAERTGQSGDDYFDMGVTAIIVAVLCARIYYVVFSWDYYRDHLSEIINLRQGGLAIYGGVIGGVAAVILFAHIRHLSWRCMLDTTVPGLVWGQMVGRWGNFFNREAFGGYTDGLFAMQIPLDEVRSGSVTQSMLDHLQTIEGVKFVQVHPTFLYESMWNLAVFLILVWLTLKLKRRFQGMVFLGYLLLYGAGRFWIEGLRTDQLLWPGTTLAVSQILSGILFVISLILLILGTLRERNKRL